MRRQGCLTMASLLFAVSGHGWAQTGTTGQEQVLVDGDVRITADMYRYEIQRYPANAQQQLRNDPEIARREIIDELYRRIKLAEEAQRRRLDEDPAVAYEVERARQVALSQALVKQLRDEVEVPDLSQAARERYLGTLDKFRVGEAVRVRHILVRPESGQDHRALAEDLLRQLQQGADFAELAKRHSQDGSSANGGDIGWIEKGVTVQPFEDAAFALQQPDEISGIVETNFGLHIVQLLERRPERQRAFDEVKDGILAEVRDEFIRKAVNEKMRVITDYSNATANQELIDEVVRAGLGP